MKFNQVPLLTEPDGSAFGTLEVATEVALLEVQTPFTSVEVIGWVRLNFEKQPTGLMFTDSENQVRVGVINDTSRMTVLEEQERWAQVKVAGWVQDEMLTPDVETVYAAGFEVYQLTCSTCHALHNPAEYRPNEWPAQVQNMVDLGLVKTVPEDDLNLIIKYLQAASAGKTTVGLAPVEEPSDEGGQ